MSLTFALGVLALAMLGAGGQGNVMPATKSGRMGERMMSGDGGALEVDAGRKPVMYLPSTKMGPMPLIEPRPPVQQQPAQTK